MIMERESNSPKKLAEGPGNEMMKGEVEKVLTAIGQNECTGKVKATRFKDKGAILLVCDDIGTKMKILRAARQLKDEYPRQKLHTKRNSKN